MGSPESTFRRVTRSDRHPWGIKLKDIPHHPQESPELLKKAKEGYKFTVINGCLCCSKSNTQDHPNPIQKQPKSHFKTVPREYIETAIDEIARGHDPDDWKTTLYLLGIVSTFAGCETVEKQLDTWRKLAEGEYTKVDDYSPWSDS